LTQQKAWVYCVVSSDRQADTLPDQASWAREAALTNGWEIARTFEGTSSGAAGTRKLLQELLDALKAIPKAQRPQRILMTRLDRTGRGLAIEPLAALAEIYNLGVIVHTRQDGDVSIRTASDALVPILRVLTGSLENEARRDKSVAMHARKRAAGEVQGLPPYGFVVVDKHLHVYEPEAAYLRQLFELRARGMGYAQLSTHARKHAPAKRLKSGTLKPVKWQTTTLTQILKNEAYRGTIIAQELFDEVVAMRRGAIARQDAKNPWPMRGALRCICGLAVTGRTSGSPPWRQRYYVCVDVAAHGGYPGQNANEIERQFGDLLAKIAANPEMIAAYKERATDVPGLRSRKHSLELELESVAKRRARVWELAEDGSIPKNDVAQRFEELRSKSEHLSQSIAETERAIVRAEAASKLWGSASDALALAAQTWATADVAAQQEIAQAVSALVGGLWVDPKRKNRLLISHGKTRKKAETISRETPYRALFTLAALAQEP